MCQDSVRQLCFEPAGIGHLSLKRKGALGVAENGGSLRRSCEFGSDMLWPPPLESEGGSSRVPIRLQFGPSGAFICLK